MYHIRQRYSYDSYELGFQACVSRPKHDLWRATISVLTSGIEIKKSTSRHARVVEEDTTMKLDAISMKNHKLDWFNSHIFCYESTSTNKTCILNSPALTVSDGSYYSIEEVGECAWTISTMDGK